MAERGHEYGRRRMSQFTVRRRRTLLALLHAVGVAVMMWCFVLFRMDVFLGWPTWWCSHDPAEPPDELVGSSRQLGGWPVVGEP